METFNELYQLFRWARMATWETRRLYWISGHTAFQLQEVALAQEDGALGLMQARRKHYSQFQKIKLPVFGGGSLCVQTSGGRLQNKQESSAKFYSLLHSKSMS